jgi:hypothetical protein
MKKLLCAALIVLAALPASAHAMSVGLGVYGGMSIPIVQEDNGQGSLYGVRVPVSLTPIVVLEPYYASTQGGNKDQGVSGITYTYDGIDNTSYGVNVLFAMGMMYPFAGLNSNHLKRSGLDETKTGYDFGLGVGFKLPIVGLSANARGALNIVSSPASTQSSRKWGEVTVGVSYDVFHSMIP